MVRTCPLVRRWHSCKRAVSFNGSLCTHALSSYTSITRAPAALSVMPPNQFSSHGDTVAMARTLRPCTASLPCPHCTTIPPPYRLQQRVCRGTQAQRREHIADRALIGLHNQSVNVEHVLEHDSHRACSLHVASQRGIDTRIANYIFPLPPGREERERNKENARIRNVRFEEESGERG